MERMQILRSACSVTILALGTLMFSSTACRSEKAEAPASNELPRSWSLEEIARATPPYGVADPVYVLAWEVIEDERPLRVERCLVLKVLEEDDQYGRWCLAHLCRRPDDEKPEWRLSTIHVLGEKGTKYWPGLWISRAKRFKQKPTNKELYAALPSEDVGWSFDRGQVGGLSTVVFAIKAGKKSSARNRHAISASNRVRLTNQSLHQTGLNEVPATMVEDVWRIVVAAMETLPAGFAAPLKVDVKAGRTWADRK